MHMRDDLLRHGSTALLAGLVASLGTAALLGGAGAVEGPSAPQQTRRIEPRDDTALIEAITEVKRAVEGVRASVEVAAAGALRRPADAAKDVEEEGEGGAGRAPVARGSDPDTRWAAPASGQARALNEMAVAAYRSRLEQYQALKDRDSRDAPRRDYYLRSLRSVLDEFGHPTSIQPNSGAIRCFWESEAGFTLRADFIDGYCVGFYD